MGRRRKSKSRKFRHAVKNQAAVKQAPQPAAVAEQKEPEPQVVSTSQWLTSFRAGCIISIVGIATFFTGFRNQFEGDDFSQIINNPVVHSLSNIKLFFEGSTYYYGNGLTPLSGAYYRPLMTTIFSLIYTFFGPHALYYHVFQTILFIGGTVLLYLVLKRPFGPIISLMISLLFLVHPLNTQLVFAIPSMPDLLLFFFGVLGFYILCAYSSYWSLAAVAVSFMLCMLSKETAACFIVLSAIYLYLWDRRRFIPFILSMIVPVALYLVLRYHAIGFLVHEHIAPIQNLDLVARILTMPAIILFYIWNFIFPWHIASEYFWTQPHFNVDHVLVPLIIDLIVVAFVVSLAIRLRKRAVDEYKMFVFFAAWTVIGFLPYLQIIPIDSTVNDAWFAISMIGIGGMIGTYLVAYEIQTRYIVAAGLVLICVLGIRSAERGLDWHNGYTLARVDVPNSPSDYIGMVNLAAYESNQHNYPLAIQYLQRSIKVEPAAISNYDLGIDQSLEGQYAASEVDYSRALKLSPDRSTYQGIDENACLTSLFTGNESSGIDICELGLNHFPKDSSLWTYLAFLEEKYGNDTLAKSYIYNASKYGTVPTVWSNEVMRDAPITINFLYSGEDLTVNPTK